jgi:two-component system sensor histidine kinase PilS (NtrC family)
MSESSDAGVVQEGLASRLKWVIAIRLVIAVLFLGSAVILHLKERPPFPTSPLFTLLAFTFSLCCLYVLLLSRVKDLITFSAFQFAADLFLSTGLVYYTGGIESPLTFVYIFPLFGAGTLMGRRGALSMASLASILFGILVDLEFYQIIPPVAYGAMTYQAPGYLVFRVFINIVAFFLVAVLSSHLAERLHEAGRQLEAHKTDLINLRTLYRDVIAHIPSGIMTLDLEGRIISFNTAAERITGFRGSEVVGRLYTEGGLRGFPGLRAFFTSGGGQYPGGNFEAPFIRKDGVVIPLGVNYSPLLDAEGRRVGAVAIFQDLTERRQMEEQLRRADRLAAVGQLAASIAHEVRNPLAAISGSIQLLQEELRGQRHERLLSIILREADRLKLITGQFLSQVRVSRGTEKTCDLVAILEETLFLLKRSEGYHPTIRFVVDKRVKALSVAGDRDRLKQVFWNIGLNALQAIATGGTFSVSVWEEKERAVVEFHDSGDGIPEESLSKIFEPFYTTKVGGTGLGLSIAKGLIEDLGGAIEVRSQRGQGTTFRISLPRPPEVRADATASTTLSSIGVQSD